MDTKTSPPSLSLHLSAPAPQWPEVSEGVRRFSGVANSGKPFGLGLWQTVVDLHNIQFKASTAILIDHSPSLRAGVGTLSVSEQGLLVEGYLLDNEHGKAVAADSDQGFPWEMSIYVQSARTEELSAGETAQVNGHEVRGPLLIMRDCTVREVSFCAVGVDGNTTALALSNEAAEAFLNQSPTPSVKEDNSMNEDEKKQLADLQAQAEALTKENAELKKAKKQADVNAKLSAAGFKFGADGHPEGLNAGTYQVLLSAEPEAAAALLADLQPKAAEKPQAEKPQVPEALLSDQQAAAQAPEGEKLSALASDAKARQSATSHYI